MYINYIYYFPIWEFKQVTSLGRGKKLSLPNQKKEKEKQENDSKIVTIEKFPFNVTHLTGQFFSYSY